jgi:hypothetical protein
LQVAVDELIRAALFEALLLLQLLMLEGLRGSDLVLVVILYYLNLLLS